MSLCPSLMMPEHPDLEAIFGLPSRSRLAVLWNGKIL